MDLNRRIEIAFECQDRDEFDRRARRLLARSVWLKRSQRFLVWLGLDTPAWLARMAERVGVEARFLQVLHNGQ